MAAVCALDPSQERIAARPQNRAVLMAMGQETFIAAMQRWREQFAKGAELPIARARRVIIPSRFPPSFPATTRPTAMPLPRRRIA